MLARSWESYCPSVRPSNACFVTNPKNLPAIFYTTWKGNPSIYSQMWFFVQWCSSWQDLNWLEASRGPSVIAELLVRNGEREILMLWYMLHSNDKHRLLQKIPDGPGTTFGWLDSGTETTSVLSLARDPTSQSSPLHHRQTLREWRHRPRHRRLLRAVQACCFQSRQVPGAPLLSDLRRLCRQSRRINTVIEWR